MAENDVKKVAAQAVKEAQRVSDEVDEKGYSGHAADPTPRENYTVAGVTAGKPTPETDEAASAAAAKARG